MATVERIIVKPGEMFGGAGVATLTTYRRTQKPLDLNDLPFDPAEATGKSSLSPSTKGTGSDSFCLLVTSESYRETLWLKAIPSIPNLVELKVQTQLFNAKRPEELRLKSRTCLDLTNLKELHNLIGQFLAAQQGA